MRNGINDKLRNLSMREGKPEDTRAKGEPGWRSENPSPARVNEVTQHLGSNVPQLSAASGSVPKEVPSVLLAERSSPAAGPLAQQKPVVETRFAMKEDTISGPYVAPASEGSISLNEKGGVDIYYKESYPGGQLFNFHSIDADRLQRLRQVVAEVLNVSTDTTTNALLKTAAEGFTARDLVTELCSKGVAPRFQRFDSAARARAHANGIVQPRFEMQKPKHGYFGGLISVNVEGGVDISFSRSGFMDDVPWTYSVRAADVQRFRDVLASELASELGGEAKLEIPGLLEAASRKFNAPELLQKLQGRGVVFTETCSG